MSIARWFSLAVFSIALAGCAGKPDVTMNLWPGLPPGDSPATQPEGLDGKDIVNVSTPTLSVYKPFWPNSARSAALVFPGGGYKKLVIEKEGIEACKWLNENGITAILVKYRVSPQLSDPKYSRALQDAQRAMCLVRAHANEWNINPKRIGVLGFSAGGRTAAAVSTKFDQLTYPAVDDNDKEMSRPDFVLAIYPGDLWQKGQTDVDADFQPPADTPPTFIAIAIDDKNGCENALYYFRALKNAGVNAELHIFGEGGHGFAFRGGSLPHVNWTDPALDWLAYRRFIFVAPTAKTD
jgi:acetyl esterase/lipase